MKGQRLSNATAGDLWYYIGRASGRDVGTVAASWTDQPGFPLVQVRERCEGGRLQVTLTQSRFALAADTAQATPAAQLWKIPVSMSGCLRCGLVFQQVHTMSITAINVRNQFRGRVKEVIEGPVVSEIDVETPSGLIVTSVITTRSVKELQLVPGKEVIALVKSTEVSIATL